jgi:hypothetical protein
MFQPTPVVQARPMRPWFGGTGPSLNIPGYSYLQSPLNDYYDRGSSFFSSGQGFRHYTHGFGFFNPPPMSMTTPVLIPPLEGVGGQPVQGVGGPANRRRVAQRPLMPLVARLNVQLPAAGEVWMDGERQSGRRATWELTSLPLPHPWSAHLFDVAARWTVGGQEFEWENKVPVVAGHTGQALVARGFPVKP